MFNLRLADLVGFVPEPGFAIIDPAVPADRPVPRHVVRNTVVAGIAGFCFAMAGVLLWYATKDIRRTPAPAR